MSTAGGGGGGDDGGIGNSKGCHAP